MNPWNHQQPRTYLLAVRTGTPVFFHCPPAEESGAELEPRKGYGKK